MEAEYDEAQAASWLSDVTFASFMGYPISEVDPEIVLLNQILYSRNPEDHATWAALVQVRCVLPQEPLPQQTITRDW